MDYKLQKYIFAYRYTLKKKNYNIPMDIQANINMKENLSKSKTRV